MKKITLLVLMFVLYLLLSSSNAQLKSLGSATKLPSELTALQIKYLEVGQYGFSVTKAMGVD